MSAKIDKTIEGMIVEIGPIESYGLRSQLVVIEESESDTKHPECAAITFFDKSLPFVAKCNQGDIVKAYFNVKAKNRSARWFNNLYGWKIELLASGRSVGEPSDQPQARQEKQDHAPTEIEENLPF